VEVDAWFAAAGDRESELRRVDALVQAAAPGIDRQLVPLGAGQMLGYGLMPYRPKSARETTMWPLISLAAQKRHLSLYVCAVVDGQYLAESRAGQLGKVSCGTPSPAPPRGATPTATEPAGTRLSGTG
jgi:hypothetical protein